jgi:RNA polymerase sigma-70 factor (ECF subfamily)
MDMAADPETDLLVAEHYQALYRFAYSLTRNESDACDLTQQTFLIHTTKSHQLNDPKKVKSWLHTTLYREFLGSRRRILRFPHQSVDESEAELPHLPPTSGQSHDASRALQALAGLDETFRAPVALFYLGDHPYQEIAEILGLPLGTVKSRLARGIQQLKQCLETPATPPPWANPPPP